MVCIMAEAGTVISLKSGETKLLANGDVVACIAEVQTAPPVAPVSQTRSCKLFVNGLPPFEGTATDDETAQARALRSCLNYRMNELINGHHFKDFNGNDFNPCVYNPSMSGIYRGYKCETVN